jgi:hypothetical protein
MNESGSTWSTPRELLSVALAPPQLKRTVSVMLVVGSAFFAMNQLGAILAGHATPLVWVKAALTYLTPFCVSNFGLLSATRRMPTARVQPPLVESDEGLTHNGQRAISGKEQGHG